MTYKEIREKINSDYNRVVSAQVLVGGKHNIKSFYVTFSKALEELQRTVGPFTSGIEDFKEQVKYKRSTVSPEVYDAMITYCKDNLGLEVL